MKLKIGSRSRGLIVAAAAVMGLAAACSPPPTPPPTPVVVYNSNLSPLPGNVSSQGYECCQVNEFGDQIQLAGSARILQKATVTMSNWALHSGANLAFGDATGWDQLLTLKLYAVGPNDLAGNPTLGATLATISQSFHIPWRPAADPVNCPSNPSKFQSTPGAADTNCFNGLATQVTFDLSAFNLTAPTNLVWGVSYNTSTNGYTPIGVPGPYDSLNVGAEGFGATVGTDVNQGVAWLAGGNYPYCDGGAGGHTFRPDVGCAVGSDWTGYTPEINITAI